MTESLGDLSRYEVPSDQLRYPTDCVIGIVPIDQAQSLIAAVKAMAIEDDAIGIIPSDRRDDFEVELTGGGIRGSIKRFVSNAGGDLDLLKGLARELQPGRVAVSVNVGEDEGLRYRVGSAFEQHRATQVNYLSRKSIETLNGKSFG